MEKTPDQQNMAAPTLCTKCMSFYANPQFGSFCSKCYKETHGELPAKPELGISESKTAQESGTDTLTKEVKQTNHDHCWKCEKKVGMSSYRCKCGYSFCKKHRMPESHECDFDFAAEGKQQLAKNNPNLHHEKVEKI